MAAVPRNLWTEFWATSVLPSKVAVIRGDDPLEDVQISTQCWVFKDPLVSSSLDPSSPDTILIRREYLDAMNDLVEFDLHPMGYGDSGQLTSMEAVTQLPTSFLILRRHRYTHAQSLSTHSFQMTSSTARRRRRRQREG